MKITFKYFSIIILLICFSCKKGKGLVAEKIENPIITEEFRLNVLNEIITDLNNRKHINSDSSFISELLFDYKKNRYHKNNSKEVFPIKIGVSKCISDYLKVKDTNYIVFQFLDKNSNIFQKINSKKLKRDTIKLSIPVFNKKLDHAYIEKAVDWANITGYLFVKKNKNWFFDSIIYSQEI